MRVTILAICVIGVTMIVLFASPSPGIPPLVPTAKSAVSDLPPESILVGPYVYQIKYRTDEELPQIGMIDPVHRTIYLRSSLEAGDMRETLLHELIHACIDVGARDSEKVTPNEFIEAVAPTMVIILRDNPEFTVWLTKKLK